MKKTLLNFLFLFLANLTIGQTNVSGGIFSNTTWDISGSPYIVTANMAVFPGYTLNIEPGVIVKFNPSTKLILRGALICSGTETNKITFTSNTSNPSIGGWQGIEIENSQGGKIIASNLKGEYADAFIRIMDASYGEVINMNNSEIKYCNLAFYGRDGDSNHTVVLDKLNVHHNGYGFIYSQNLTVTNSVFSDGEKGIHCWENIPNMHIKNCEFFNFSIWPLNTEGEIDNCNIHNNAVGIHMKPNLIVKNSSIKSNKIGIAVSYPIPISGSNIHDNTICDNTQYNVKHFYSYPINISNNCWCSSVTNDILKTIYDGYDDISLGIVTISSITNCSLNVPDLTINTLKPSFYPNPSHNQIRFEEEFKKNYSIYSMNGSLVKQGIVEKELDISNIPIGIYILKTSKLDQSECTINKLIKN